MIINMIINTVGVSKVFLKIRTQESTGLRVDFTHVIQVKSDERLFLKKKQRKKTPRNLLQLPIFLVADIKIPLLLNIHFFQPLIMESLLDNTR